MVYKIQPQADRQYIEEFRQKPIGVHSPGLQRLLNILRHDPSGWQVILVCRRPFAEWVLGRMPPNRADPIQSKMRPSSPAARKPNGKSSAGAGGSIPARRSISPFATECSWQSARQPTRQTASVLKIIGYPDRYSVAPGETSPSRSRSRRAIGSTRASCASSMATAIRKGPGSSSSMCRPPSTAAIPAGRSGSMPAPTWWSTRCRRWRQGAFTFFAMIWPTLPDGGPDARCPMGPAPRGGLPHRARRGRPPLGDRRRRRQAATATLSTDQPCWSGNGISSVVAIDPAARRVTLDQRPVQPYAQIDDAGQFQRRLLPIAPARCRRRRSISPAARKPTGRSAAISTARSTGRCSCQGFIRQSDHQALLARSADPALAAAIIARWDFSKEIPSTTRAVDVGPRGHHGRLVHLPARGMKGWNWTGEEHSWTRKPEHYGAIHFHSDDVYDAGWETSVALTIPEDLQSGPYALHVSCGESDATATREDYLAFFVRPPRSPDRRQEPPAGRSPGADLLLPRLCQSRRAHHRARPPSCRWAGCCPSAMPISTCTTIRKLGGSLYDSHADGSGVCYSSRLRPNLNIRRAIIPGSAAMARRSTSTTPTPISSTGSTITASTMTSSPTRTCTKTASSSFATTG